MAAQITRRNLLGLTGAGAASLALNRAPEAFMPRFLPTRSKARVTVEMESTPDAPATADANATPHPVAGGHYPKYAQAPLGARDGAIRLWIPVDQSSVEVFANDGERTMTALMFPDPASTGIELFAEGGRGVVQDLRAWELASIWGVSQEAWRRG